MEETVQTTENTAVETPNTTAEDIGAAMDNAIDAAVAERVGTTEAQEEAAPVEATVEPSENKAEPAQAEHQAAQEPAPDFTKEHALFERAVRAGIPVKDVLNIPTYEMAERLVETAEKANGISKPNEVEEKADDDNSADDLENALKEMESDGDYDPKILRLLKGLYRENQTLKQAGTTAAKQSFFDQQYGKLDETLRGHVDAVHKSMLKSKFELLEAGYKAQGSKIGREDIFAEAARYALGDVIGRVAEDRRAASLEQRKNLTLARPGGENGQRRTGKPVTEEDIASELWEQIIQ